MPFEGISTVQFISEYRSVFLFLLSGLHLNYWLLWGQSKHAAIQQICNHEDSLFNRHKYAVCAVCKHLMFVFCPLKSGFCCMCVGPRVKLSESKDCQMKSSSSSPLANKLFCVTEDNLLWFCGFDVDGSLFLEEREPNQKQRGQTREPPLCSNVWIHSGLLWLLLERGVVSSACIHILCIYY